MNWLEYFRKGNLEQAVNCVRKIFLDKGYGIRVNGRFVKLQVGKVLSAILESGSSLARVEHLPENDDPSHCGIFGYAANDLYVAGIIAYMIHVENDVYPGKLTQH